MFRLIKVLFALLFWITFIHHSAQAETRPGTFGGSKSCPKGYYFIPPCPAGKQCAWRGNVCMKYPTSPEHWPLIRRPGSPTPGGSIKPSPGNLSNPAKPRADQSFSDRDSDTGFPSPESPLFKNRGDRSDDSPMKHCITREAKWGENCGNPDSLKIVFHNQCSTTVELKYCLERANGKWVCGRVSQFDVDEETQGAWICSATGRYEWSVNTVE